MTTVRGTKRVNVAEAPRGKAYLLRVLRGEADGFFQLVLGADEHGWHAPTPCAGWEVRDIVAHMTEAGETYIGRYHMALAGWPVPEPLGLRGYARALYEGALAMRGIPNLS